METTADFIIVGGGTAGLLLANRLASTTSKPSVLVIEAGSDQSALSYRNPLHRFSLASANQELNHGYSTVPQLGMAGRELPYERGKGLGGSSLINFMVWLSGSKEDYNYWGELVGDDDWKWENAKRRLKQIETFNGRVPPGYEQLVDSRPEDHGNKGPIDVGFPAEWETGTREIINEAAKQGIQANLDINSGDPLGISLSPTTGANGYRNTSATANLKNKPDNLTIWTKATVKRIIFEGKRAKEVEILDGRQAFAKHEIILTAGTFDTPKLLMLSGIGPRDHLSQHGIPTIQHLPGIGQALKDHPAASVTALMRPGFSTRMEFETSPDANTAAAAQWAKDGTGRYATELQSLIVQFSKLPSIYTSSEFLSLPQDVKEYLRRDTVPTYEAIFNGPRTVPVKEGHEYFGISIVCMNAQSLGTVTLASSNPEDKPVIDIRALTHPYDRKVLIESTREVMQFFQETDIYKQAFVEWIKAPRSESVRDVEAYVEEGARLVWHASGTAKMGRVGEEDTCVDTGFRVVGVEGLRVADCSVAPVLINGHTQAMAYLIAETAAEKLIQEYKL